MKILLLHEWGPQGRLIMEALRETPLDCSPLLLSKPGAIELERLADWIPGDVELVVNALTSQDPCWAEDNPGQASHQLRALPLALLDLCRQRNLALVQFSSCYIFDGRKQSAYITSNPGQPISLLGQLQWDVEQELRARLQKHLILRLGWPLRRFIRMARNEKQLILSSRFQGQPTAMADVARVLVAILLQLDCGAEAWGTYHYAGAEELSLHELGLTISETLGPAASRKVLDKAAPWTRWEPENAVLGCAKLRNTFGIKQRGWRDYLEQEAQACEESGAEQLSHGTS